MEILKSVSVIKVSASKYMSFPLEIQQAITQHNKYNATFIIDDITKELKAIELTPITDTEVQTPIQEVIPT